MARIFFKAPRIIWFTLSCSLLIPMITVFAKNYDPKEMSVFLRHTESEYTDTSTLSLNEQKESSKSSLYLQFNTSALFASLADWKSQLHMSDGTHPSSSCIVFGAEGGWVINEYLQIGIGYEFFFTTKVTANETPGDQVNSTFFYGSLKASTAIESVPELYLFGGLDIGSIKATEVIENYYFSGNSFNRTGTTNAYRLTVGAQYYLIDNWSIMAGTGYLFGTARTITGGGQTWPNFSLDLSGFTLRFAVNYHIAL
jgi:long-subunit fatty acid transport protein